MRSSGILMHITSLPSPYGIGSMGEEAKRFVDFLVQAGQTYWQILPIGPTGAGDSPYQSVSAFAGNPFFIDLEYLCNDGLLKAEECQEVIETCQKEKKAVELEKDEKVKEEIIEEDTIREDQVDFEVVAKSRDILFRKAYERFQQRIPSDYQAFCEEQSDWLEEYAVFMVLKERFDQAPWYEWPEKYKMHDEKTIADAKEKYKDEMGYYIMVQFLFRCHWQSLKWYANDRGVKIIGDIPIYVSADSVDVWSDPKQFQLDENREMILVSGCPPDAFSAEGQLWGNPLFDWEYMEQHGYDWWCRRVGYLSKLLDVVRIDHFRGFDSYYAIPAEAEDAKSGEWKRGPGRKLFHALEQQLGELHIIVEDLGMLDDSVRQLVKDVGYPGMKILQFAFDGDCFNPYLPHNYERNCVVYTGTHDNDTTRHWFETLSEYASNHVRKYMHIKDAEDVSWIMMKTAWASVADTCIVTMQDLLDLGAEARMNTPSTPRGNWRWRAIRGSYDETLARKIAENMRLYGR